MNTSIEMLGILVGLATVTYQVQPNQVLADMVAKATSSMSGHVVFRETGKPVVGAKMRPSWLGGNGVAWTEATTDQTGYYSLKALPGRWNMGLVLPPNLREGFTCLGVIHINLEKSESKTVNLEVFKGNRVSGKVTLPDGKPAVGAYVQANFMGRGPGLPYPACMYVATVDKDGNYVLNLPPGHFGLHSSCKANRKGYDQGADLNDVTKDMHQDIKLVETFDFDKFDRENSGKKGF